MFKYAKQIHFVNKEALNELVQNGFDLFYQLFGS